MGYDRKYASCSVAGDGKLTVASSEKVEKFKIINMSAAEINIETSAEIPEGMSVKLKIRLIGGVIDAHLDVNGKVLRKIEKGYEISFFDLSDSDREEIDELMRDTCNINE